jgi:hypothetical protein
MFLICGEKDLFIFLKLLYDFLVVVVAVVVVVVVE